MFPLSSPNQFKSLVKRYGPKAPTATHGPSGLKFLLLGKAIAFADCRKNQFTQNNLCDEHHEQRVEA
jgi:hypothetical protein